MSATKPVWIRGTEATAPSAGSQLVKAVPSAGRLGIVYAFRIASQEANAAGKTWRLQASIGGTVITIADVDITNPTFGDLGGLTPIFYLQGNGVDFFQIVNVAAGTASCIHQASILYGEQEP